MRQWLRWNVLWRVLSPHGAFCVLSTREQALRVADRHERGQCIGCGGVRPRGRLYCRTCRKPKNENAKERYYRLKSEGRCVRCGEDAMGNGVQCVRCADIQNAAKAERKARAAGMAPSA